jgi:Na+-transporting NADH:ubiquinone oxidoreductase subunit B
MRMLRSFLDAQLKATAPGTRFEKLHPLVSALDSFLFKVSEQTSLRPFIRDAVDLKRWMMIVIFALTPCIFVSIWNSGLMDLVYTSSDYELVKSYVDASASLRGYFSFCFSDGRWIEILLRGASLFLPLVFISYLVGGLWEAFFACVRGHEINEGFLVTGMLFPLTLPPTLPYWMAALGISFGIVIAKELFGGTGMNILNPALSCRTFLFFAFPGRMTGEVWVGDLPQTTAKSLSAINAAAKAKGADTFSQVSPLGHLNIPDDIKRIHIDALSGHESSALLEKLQTWGNALGKKGLTLKDLSPDELKAFISESISNGGLGLEPNYFTPAYEFLNLKMNSGLFSLGNLGIGNRIGSFGETSLIAILIGAAILIWTGIGSWRTMVSMLLGALVTALLFQLGSHMGADSGLWNPAKFDFPFYKHLFLGSLLFGAVFFATDPVSSPYMKSAKWIYGLGAGALVVIIRLINPAFPEGVALSILFMNVFAPLIDHLTISRFRRHAHA